MPKDFEGMRMIPLLATFLFTNRLLGFPMTDDKSNNKTKFSAKIIGEWFRMVKKWTEEAFDFSRELDWLGDAKQHAEGSDQRELALVLGSGGRRAESVLPVACNFQAWPGGDHTV
jgi:hypothetical protein